MNVKVAAFRHVYSKRHKYYKLFMQQVQGFILKMTKMANEKRGKKKKEDDPFSEQGEEKKVEIPRAMPFEREEGEAMRLEIRKVEFKDERNNEE